MGTCTQNINFVGTQIFGYSKFVGAKLIDSESAGQRFVGTISLWVLKFVGIHNQKFIDTQNLGHYHFWILKICGYQKML